MKRVWILCILTSLILQGCWVKTCTVTCPTTTVPVMIGNVQGIGMKPGKMNTLQRDTSFIVKVEKLYYSSGGKYTTTTVKRSSGINSIDANLLPIIDNDLREVETYIYADLIRISSSHGAGYSRNLGKVFFHTETEIIR